MIDALVVFEHNNLHPLSSALKSGYRHVWCAVIDDRNVGWVSHDLRLTGYVSSVLCAPEYPLAEHLAADGNHVIGLSRTDYRAAGPFILNNCVGLTKAVCGIRSWALTPWQLCKYLTKTKAGVSHVTPQTFLDPSRLRRQRINQPTGATSDPVRSAGSADDAGSSFP